MSLSGDFPQLGRIASSVSSLADVPAIAQDLASDRIAALVQLEFDAGVDPYGVAWTDLSEATIAKGRHAPPLTDTRQLRESLLVYPSRRGLARDDRAPRRHPAGPHQDGWEGRQGSGPARPMLPTGDLPESWQMAIEDSTIEAVTAKLAEVRT